mmetsp:Transcript_67796/g.196047  ORF Transcript_67796/g.196047 Transcript_67796/m.196047 type:complete len:231 (-) Transcript_67796:15-707(-)
MPAPQQVRGDGVEEGLATEGELREGPEHIGQLEGLHFPEPALGRGRDTLEEELLTKPDRRARPADDAQATHFAGLLLGGALAGPDAGGANVGGNIVDERPLQPVHGRVRLVLLPLPHAASQGHLGRAVHRCGEINEVHALQVGVDYLEEVVQPPCVRRGSNPAVQLLVLAARQTAPAAATTEVTSARLPGCAPGRRSSVDAIRVAKKNRRITGHGRQQGCTGAAPRRSNG